MHVCYLDEAGCTGALPDPSSQIQPVFVICGVFVDETRVKSLTNGLIQLKQRFFPNLIPSRSLYHDWMRAEAKGSELRKKARSQSRNDRRHSYMAIGKAIELLESHGARFVARAYAKPIGGTFDGTSVYTSSVQNVCASFQSFLSESGSRGIVIADSRNKGKNSGVSHSVFTQRHSAGGDPYPSMVEVPTFGHSDNHAGLQLADFLCSALIFPIVAQECFDGRMADTTHLSPLYRQLAVRFGERIRNLQYRFKDADGNWRGGLAVIDPQGRKSAKSVLAAGQAAGTGAAQ